MTDRKPRPLWPLVTAALIGLPVLYVASFGPACWLVWSDWAKGWPIDGMSMLASVYAPIFWLMGTSPEPIADALIWYATMP